MSKRLVCPNGKEHDEFLVEVRVEGTETWVVNELGEYLDIDEDHLSVYADPRIERDVYTCNDCGATAGVEEI